MDLLQFCSPSYDSFLPLSGVALIYVVLWHPTTAPNTERISLDGTIVHSDRGTQYCSKLFQSRLNELNMRSSMSEVGQCWDNAPGEAIWSSLKRETLIGRRMFSSHEAAAREVTHWINIYNQLRPHSAIGMQIPLEYDRSLKSRRMSA